MVTAAGYNGVVKVTATSGDITATKEIRYIISAGIPMEITFFDHEVESSVFDIPEDYEYVSMAEMNG